MPEVKVAFQDKQREFVEAVDKYPVVFYGGAKGGGKSYALRNILLMLISQHKHSKALLVRKTYDELVSNHIEAFFKENPVLLQYYSKGEKMLQLPNKATLRFRHLQHPSDVYNYQGQEFDFIGIDELTQHQKEIFTILRSSNRTTNPKIKPKMILTGNPGGIGHGWVRKLFIGKEYEKGERPENFFFVPAKVYDNAELMDNDPEYLERLKALPEDLRRAYLDGDWDVFAGQFFREWNRDIHVVRPFELAPQFKRVIGVDYGYKAPSSVHWYAVDYLGRLICYRELYEEELTFSELGRKIALMTPEEEKMTNGTFYNERANIDLIAVDPSIQARTTESGIAGDEILRKAMTNNGLKAGIVPANNNRKYGWGVVREFLRPIPNTDGTPTAGIVWFDTCLNACRTIPEQIYSSVQVEDLDTSAEDHVADETRYVCVTIRTAPSDKDRMFRASRATAKEKAFYKRMKSIKKGIKQSKGKYVY